MLAAERYGDRTRIGKLDRIDSQVEQDRSEWTPGYAEQVGRGGEVQLELELLVLISRFQHRRDLGDQAPRSDVLIDHRLGFDLAQDEMHEIIYSLGEVVDVSVHAIQQSVGVG